MALHVFSYNYGKIKINSDNNLLLEQTLTFYVIIHTKFVPHENHKDCYYYHIFLEKSLYQLARK